MQIIKTHIHVWISVAHETDLFILIYSPSLQLYILELNDLKLFSCSLCVNKPQLTTFSGFSLVFHHDDKSERLNWKINLYKFSEIILSLTKWSYKNVSIFTNPFSLWILNKLLKCILAILHMIHINDITYELH